jgi:signal transduction histidine kinase
MCFVWHASARLFRTESFRLAALLALLFISASIGLAATMFVATKNALDAEFIGSVRSNIAAVEEAYRNEGLAEAIEIVRQLTATAGGNDYYLLQDQQGTKLAGNLPAMAPVFVRTMLPPPAGVAQLPEPGEHGILGEGKLLPDGSYLFVGADGYELTELREHILLVFALVTGGTIVLALGAGAFLSAGVLRRTDAIVAVCRAIAADRWDQRVPVRAAGGESDLLAITINGMLDRLAALMENLRQVSTDIAHDLRTPLTHMRQRLERAQAEAATTGDYALAVERALLDSEEILSIFSALLSLSQIEAGARSARLSPVDLSGLLTHLAETYRPVADDHGHAFTASIERGVTVTGDRALLMQMFANLIENAIRHSSRGAHIALTLGASSAQIVDSGPGVREADRERIFDRFWRGEASRGTPGNGLGMSLVAAIAKLHGIAIELGDNRPGLAVTLHFAAAARQTIALERAG